MNILFKIISFLSLLLISCNVDSSFYKRIQGDALGTTYKVIVQSEYNSSVIKQSIDSIFEVVNNSMSTYRTSSIISRVNRSQNPVEVDSHFIEVFKKSQEIWKLSNGYFDPTAGSIVNLYGMGPNTNVQSINRYKIDSVMQYVGLDKVYLDKQNRIVKPKKGVYIDFNAIAKGYSVDLIKDLLMQINSENFLIEVGGELITMGKNEKNKKWKVAIQNPIDLSSYYSEISLDGMSLATSGNYRKFRVDSQTGARYAHIVNPINGESMTNNILSASVVSSSCIEADAWATSLMLMDPIEAAKIINNIADIEVLILTAIDDQIIPIKSDGWDLITR
ncbi:MAG: FAD:protein FMN transferase [Flavobacteriales bacterium]|nr:MAG: FAD:protein FMN transferase [Flavobacteriales bacterium]CAI8332960.1 MAG: FAD:protein FMN transferase [Flavobacteriales bacterium]